MQPARRLLRSALAVSLLLFPFAASSFPLACPAAHAADLRSRVLINGALRQLRTVRVRATGYSILADAAPASRQRVSALHHARERAVEMVRAALEQDISRRGLNVGFFFPGAEPTDAVFERTHRDLPPDSTTGFGVELDAEVIYVLTIKPRGLQRNRPGLPDNALQMAPAGQSAPPPDADKLRSDFARAMDSLDKALKERMKQDRQDKAREDTQDDNGKARPDGATPLRLAPIQGSGAD